MDYTHKTDEELIQALETSGRTPPVALIRAFLKRQEALTPALLLMFAEGAKDEWSDEADARWYRAVHAGRLLIAYREERALPLFEQLYASRDEADQHFIEWFETDLAHYGATAVPAMKRVVNLDTGGDYHYGRALAVSVLSIIALQHPAEREGVLTFFRSLLPPLAADGDLLLPEDGEADETWGDVAVALLDLRDEVSRPQVEALLANNRINPMMLSWVSYQEEMVANTPPYDADFSFDILKLYQPDPYQRNQSSTENRRDLLRDQGFLPPTPEAKPFSNRLTTMFNKQVLALPSQKIGRNDPCPCGSGQKYKKCHGKKGAPPLPNG